MRPNREQAKEILYEYVETEALRRHGEQVATVMEYLGEKANEDSELWMVVGLLHDLDYEKWPEEHCSKTAEILREKGIDEEIVRAVVSHGWEICSDVEPQSKLEKTLYAIDELTGLIWATALMRPSRSVLDMEAKSVKKKFKDKRFASGVNREIVRRGAEMLEIELDELFTEVLEGMKKWETNQ